MVDTLVLGTSAAMRGGSSPLLGTQSIESGYESIWALCFDSQEMENTDCEIRRIPDAKIKEAYYGSFFNMIVLCKLLDNLPTLH